MRRSFLIHTYTEFFFQQKITQITGIHSCSKLSYSWQVVLIWRGVRNSEISRRRHIYFKYIVACYANYICDDWIITYLKVVPDILFIFLLFCFLFLKKVIFFLSFVKQKMLSFVGVQGTGMRGKATSPNRFSIWVTSPGHFPYGGLELC